MVCQKKGFDGLTRFRGIEKRGFPIPQWEILHFGSNTCMMHDVMMLAFIYLFDASHKLQTYF